MLRRTHIRLAGLLLPALILMTLAGCGGQKQEQMPAGSGQTQEEVSAPSASGSETLPAEPEAPSEPETPASPEQTPEEVPSGEAPPPEPEPSAPPGTEETPPLRVSAPEDIQAELYDAICAVRQPAPMDISGITLGEKPEMDVKNLYYNLTSRYPALKYAYDVSATVENGTLTCQIAYMPYKTGNWPENRDTLTVSSLGELLCAAEEHIGPEPLPIRLTDPSLVPDEMGRVLQQADHLAEQIVAREVTDTMTEREKAEALYTYLISHVKYDQRYYADRANMPYDAQTAIGALRDNLAICGGYSHALKLLFEKAGIPCLNMTGKYFSENHMWSLARVDGAWLWFDATSDRGVSPAFGLRHFGMEELDATQYRWDPATAELLLRLGAEQP